LLVLGLVLNESARDSLLDLHEAFFDVLRKNDVRHLPELLFILLESALRLLESLGDEVTPLVLEEALRLAVYRTVLEEIG